MVGQTWTNLNHSSTKLIMRWPKELYGNRQRVALCLVTIYNAEVGLKLSIRRRWEYRRRCLFHVRLRATPASISLRTFEPFGNILDG